jgi:cytochrome oxidase Cu insertion factor (SCO1/SenC/PrrC family)
MTLMFRNFFFCAVAFCSISVTGCREKKEVVAPAVATETPAAPAVKNERPVMRVQLTDGTNVDMATINEKAVLVLFQPDCDDCQNESKSIQQRIADFKDYKLYFISSYPLEIIQKFAVDYQLAGLQNVYFGMTTVQDVLNNYGPIHAPSIYVYTKDGKLLKSFSGTTDVEKIIEVL